MPYARIELPRNLNHEALFKFVLELDYYASHDRLIIDLPEQVFVSPFSMLLIASKIRYMKEKCEGLSFIFNGWEKYEYLSHMAFFAFCGFSHGKEVGQATGGLNYLPISKIDRQDFYEKPVDKYEELPDLIQRHVDRIAEVLVRDKTNKDAFDVLSYSIREVFRNVFEHSEAQSLHFCAQYWPTTNRVEFAVADFGIGIRRALGLNPNFRFQSDKEAIEWSLLPSVSGRTHMPRTSSVWHNSGYGLYMTSRFSRNGGNFVIVSGDDAIHLTPRQKYNHKTRFPGTAIKVSLNVPEIGRVQDRLDEFRREGAEIAAEIKGAAARPPSAMSLLLRRDYRRGSRS